MVTIKPFRAVRPSQDYVKEVAALPYDVYTREGAAAAVSGHPLSFLNIDRPETMFGPEQDMYADEVYRAAADRYRGMKQDGIFLQEETPCFYIYEETMQGRSQRGIAALSSVDDYLANVCRKHENTVEAKEQDRIRHVDALSAQTGPIFLSFRTDPEIRELMDQSTAETPVYDFVSEDGVGHRVWVVSDPERIRRFQEAFAKLEATYIADGHHRAASAVKVALKRREAAAAAGLSEEETKDAEYNYFLSVLFPEEELKILDYNRIVKDLNGLDPDGLLEAMSEHFEIRMTSLHLRPQDAEELLRPKHKHEIGLYLNGRSYLLTVRPEIAEAVAKDPVASLDVAILQDRVLEPLLGIQDPRTDRRIRFVGGIAGLEELVREADGYLPETAAAFAMYPTSIDELFRVADAGLLMPPKSTWFEPKLRSGLLIHEF